MNSDIRQSVRRLAMFGLVALLSGCSTMRGFVSTGTQANDAAVHTAEFTLCRGISIGAWLRAYGNDAKKAAAWRVLCSDEIANAP